MADVPSGLVECYPVADTYADGLGRVEKTGQNLRFVMYVSRAQDDGTLDREIVQRVVVPIDALVPAVLMLLAMPSIGMTMMKAFTEYLASGRPSALN